MIPAYLRHLYVSGVYFTVESTAEPKVSHEVRYDERRGRLLYKRAENHQHDLIVEQVIRVSPDEDELGSVCQHQLGFAMISTQGVSRYMLAEVSPHDERDEPSRGDFMRSNQRLHEVNSAMTGRVVQVNIKPQDYVQAGECLMIVEAMKMENKITAPTSGVIKTVKVTEGASVAVGGLLCSIEPEPGETGEHD